MASFTPTPDLPILVTSPSTSSERRITPSWTVSQLKQKLEFVTGIPPSAQRLQWRRPGADAVWMDGDDEEIGRWGLVKGGEIEIQDLRPPSAAATLTALTDPSASPVEKFTLPTTTYESLPNTVLSWKKTNQLGRFDPRAPAPDQLAAERSAKDSQDIERKRIAVGNRCLVGEASSPDGRRGTVRFVGPIEELPGGGLWVGVECDEPVGKNDGTVMGRRVFEQAGQGGKRGLFVRPERVTTGDYPPLEDLDAEEEI